MSDQLEGVSTVSTKPALRITPGDVPAPFVTVNLSLFGGHMDGLGISEVEVPGVWPVITTLEKVAAADSGETRFFIPRRYKICMCFGRVQLDRRRRIRYCLEVERSV